MVTRPSAPMSLRMSNRIEMFFLREWQQPSMWQGLLLPMSWLFRLIVALRRAAFHIGLLSIRRASRPLIVVGNISLGGTGKTPLVLALTAHLARLGWHPGIVTRGYVPQVSADGKHVAVSDEVNLFERRSTAPVIADADRPAAALSLLNHHAEVDVIVSDDGLQHYRLHRDIEIAVVDGERGFGNGSCLPAGPLREPIGRLRQVDCIVLNNTSIGAAFQAKMPENARRLDTLRDELASFGVPLFDMRYGNERLVPLAQSDATTGATPEQGITPGAFVRHLAGRRVAAIAGIGHPPRFFQHLKQLGIETTTQLGFPDHHMFIAEDLASIDADVIVMTEKDAVKCLQFDDARLWMVQVDALLPDAFYEFVVKTIAHVA